MKKKLLLTLGVVAWIGSGLLGAAGGGAGASNLNSPNSIVDTTKLKIFENPTIPLGPYRPLLSYWVQWVS